MTTPLLHGDKLTCFTAALAGALTARGDQRWWRPLLSEGPYLAVSPAEGELLRFEHHPAAPLPTLGLRIAGSDDWDCAYAALAEQISRHGAVVLLADYFNLPWQRAHGKLHGTHWLAIVDRGNGWVIEDPLEFATDLGPQVGSSIAIPDPVELRSWATSLGDNHPASALREQAMAGHADIALDRAYRWLEVDPDPLVTPAPEGRLVGKDALLALAARYRFARTPADFAQSEDLWQTMRQRETLLWAAGHDPEVLDEGGRAHWERAVARWQALTPLLLHARLRAEHGGTVNTGLIAETLTELADFEDEHLAYGARRTKGD
ncbi:hypothetical protein NDR87_34630 [Nocardia sp. CDC159]|uniref:Uncharacterized protein n=1 Tax=Nocardia pulmonis TaxID=2951408 RepID=A0A9X2J184_9NOCA|nr:MULTISPECIES: hypothetical protein [Nocardia]MCM6778629.1 hypothetical protein [Nocardia pulmonis]MCM6791518.1 hypothetical protein [Nocardia sp. CDC159]